MGFGQLIAQRLGDRPRDAWRRIDLVEDVTGPLEELNLAQAQPEYLVAINRLQEASQWFGVKAVGDNSQLGDRTLEWDHMKHARPA